MPTDKPAEALSIGSVAKATGIGIETLRMWERRYGSPKSIRLPSGHRRYPVSEVERLRAVARALELGFRARDVAGASLEELRAMIERARRLKPGGRDATLAASSLEQEINKRVTEWIDATTNFDDNRLNEELYADWARLGPLRFLDERVSPFLTRLGDDWRDGELAVGHEHFASERLGDFLASQWRRMNERTTGRPIVIASLPGDLHRLGLQIASVVTALAERKVVYIGPQTPPEELVKTIDRFNPTAICLSISVTMDRNHTTRMLEQLRLEVPRSVPIAVGGDGAPSTIAGVQRFETLEAYYEWLRKLS